MIISKLIKYFSIRYINKINLNKFIFLFFLAPAAGAAVVAAKAKAARMRAARMRNMMNLLAVGPDDMSGWDGFWESRPAQ